MSNPVQSQEFVCFSELNDHEGEKWKRFIAVGDENLPKLQLVIDSLAAMEEEPSDLPYGFEKDDEGNLITYSYETASVLVDDSDSGYETFYGFADVADLKSENDTDSDDFDFFDDQVYKLSWVKK